MLYWLLVQNGDKIIPGLSAEARRTRKSRIRFDEEDQLRSYSCAPYVVGMPQETFIGNGPSCDTDGRTRS